MEIHSYGLSSLRMNTLQSQGKWNNNQMTTEWLLNDQMTNKVNKENRLDERTSKKKLLRLRNKF